MDGIDGRLRENLTRVSDELAAACARAGRSPDSVRLVAVTKYVRADIAQRLVQMGCLDLGESRPQELVRKATSIEGAVRWHLVGHLQRNKVRLVVPHVSLIHSVDSDRLMEGLEGALSAQRRVADALIEVNISGEAAKHGSDPAELERLLTRASELRSLRVRGLMGMAALHASEAESRHQFERLRQYRDRHQERFPNLDLRELSMGMSGDYPQAIAAGATIVRIGSAIFESVE